MFAPLLRLQPVAAVKPTSAFLSLRRSYASVVNRLHLQLLEQQERNDLTTHIGTLFPRNPQTGDSFQLADALSSDSVVHDLAILVAHRGVVFFKNQKISIAEQKKLILKLGELTGRPADSSLHVHPIAEDTPELGKDVSVISSKDGIARGGVDQNLLASSGWHSDISFEHVPADFSILKMHTLPSVGGDTLWASGYEAYDRLSRPLQLFLESLTAVHSADFFVKMSQASGRPMNMNRGTPENNSRDLLARHPVIRTHPVTGFKTLWVNRCFTEQLAELSKDESKVLLDYLFRVISENHDLQVRYRWEKNDVAIWDNRCTFHTATNDYGDEFRAGDRVVGVGERPYFDPFSQSRREVALLQSSSLESSLSPKTTENLSS